MSSVIHNMKPSRYTPATEDEARLQLATCYRACAQEGWTDLQLDPHFLPRARHR